jgi:hypothetical protein
MSSLEQFLAAKARGATAGATDLGVVGMGVRKDAATDLAGADGKYAPPQLDGSGNLRVIDEAAAAKLEAIKGFVDNVETLQAATNTALAAISGFVDGLEAFAAAATPAGENFIGGVGGRAAVVPVAMTRPNDATAYAAGDMFGNLTANSGNNIFTLPVSRANDKSAIISRIRAKMKGSANWAGKQVKFHFFKSLPVVTTIGDNGAFAGGNTTTESNKIGTATVTFDSTQTSDGFVKGFSYPDDTAGVVWTVEPATSTPNIYAIAEVVGAVTPAAQDILTLTLEVAGQN